MAEKEWYADGLSFSCTQCGNCCSGPPGYVWFSDEEAVAMAKDVGLKLDEFLRRYCKRINGQWSLDERWNPQIRGYDCVFLQRDDQGKALCTIYKTRPQQCRTWPFWPENLRRPRDWEQSSRRCPGMDKGKFYPIEQIRIIRDSNPEQ